MNKLREQYKTVDLWIRKACGSETTEKVYLCRIRKFIEEYNVNPDTLIQQWKQVRYDYTKRQQFIDTWIENVEDYYAYAEGTPLNRNSIVIPIVSFFKHNKIPIEIDVNKNIYVVYHNRDIKREEIKTILEHSTLRNKTFYLVSVESGLRPRTICKLQYKYIKEDFEAERIPMKIDTPASIIKDNVGDRFTFIGEDGFNALKEYLKPKLPLNDNDYIFTPEKSFAKTSYVSPESVSNAFSKTVLRLKLDEVVKRGKPKSLRLYCLKKYFRNNIKVEEGYRKFWMGRTMRTDAHYISRDVEVHRKLYAEAYPNIRIYETMVKVTPQMYENLLLKNVGLKKELETLKERLSEQSIEALIKKVLKEKDTA